MSTHQLASEFITLNPHGCAACWHCIRSCPKQVIGKVGFMWHRHAVLINADACIGCGKCVKICHRHCFAMK